jgi:Tfp pilus assembly protein PilF
MNRRRVLVFLSALSLVPLIVGGCATGAKTKDSPEEKAQLFLEAAAAAKGEGDATGALQYLVEAERLNPKLPEVYHLRSIVLNMKHEPALSIAAARRALELRPNYSDAMNTLGRLLMENANSGVPAGQALAEQLEAEKWLTRAASDLYYRDAWKPRTNLGILHYRKGEDAVALESFTKAVDSAPAQACIAHYYIGHIRLKSGAFLEAARSYDRATQKFCAGFADAHLAEGVALERAREYDKARKKFLEITRNFPNSAVSEQAVARLKNIP